MLGGKTALGLCFGVSPRPNSPRHLWAPPCVYPDRPSRDIESEIGEIPLGYPPVYVPACARRGPYGPHCVPWAPYGLGAPIYGPPVEVAPPPPTDAQGHSWNYPGHCRVSHRCFNVQEALMKTALLASVAALSVLSTSVAYAADESDPPLPRFRPWQQ